MTGALLTDLSKAFDCILRDLSIAKLAAYGFDYKFLLMLQRNLSNRKQRIKINDAYSKYCEISIVNFVWSSRKPHMFYDINDFDIASYADDNTTYASSSSLDALINKPEEST